MKRTRFGAPLAVLAFTFAHALATIALQWVVFAVGDDIDDPTLHRSWVPFIIAWRVFAFPLGTLANNIPLPGVFLWLPLNSLLFGFVGGALLVCLRTRWRMHTFGERGIIGREAR